MRKNNVRIAALGVAAALLVGTMSISPAWSYFTDSHETEGGIRISVEPRSDIEEEYDGNVKHVRIRNTSEDVPLWVRARAYVPNGQLSYIGNDPEAGGSWYDGGDDWWYSSEVLEPGAVTDELHVVMEFKVSQTTIIYYPDGTKEAFPVETHEGENTNIVVVYEAVPVQGKTNPQDADWLLPES